MNFYITHYDTAMVCLEIGPFRLLTDPVLDAKGSIYKYPSFELKKTHGIGNAADMAKRIGPVDAVLLSHAQHSDNLDEAGRDLVYTMPKILTAKPSSLQLEKRRPANSKADIIGLDNWDSYTLQGSNGDQLRITAVPAQHAPGWMFPEKLPSIGKVIGFVIEWPGQKNGVLYITGDTIPFSGLREIAKRFPKISVGLFHLGAARFPITGPIKFSLTAQAALKVDAWLKPGLIIPIHYDGWQHFSETPTDVQLAFDRAGRSSKLQWLKRGSRTTLEI
jgi:L-ascorbate metabolism protein UlaG (beta-lactamase superfamily)